MFGSKKAFPSIFIYEDGLETQHAKCGRTNYRHGIHFFERFLLKVYLFLPDISCHKEHVFQATGKQQMLTRSPQKRASSTSDDESAHHLLSICQRSSPRELFSLLYPFRIVQLDNLHIPAYNQKEGGCSVKNGCATGILKRGEGTSMSLDLLNGEQTQGHASTFVRVALCRRAHQQMREKGERPHQ